MNILTQSQPKIKSPYIVGDFFVIDDTVASFVAWAKNPFDQPFIVKTLEGPDGRLSSGVRYTNERSETKTQVKEPR